MKQLKIFLVSMLLITVVFAVSASGFVYGNTIKKDKPFEHVPILMYHHIAESGNTSTTISEKRFEEQIEALCNAGYNTISFDELENYVFKDADLPENPIILTFDDGYLSNYNIAYPILKKYNMKATIFVIGISVGKTKYKDTEYPITPHFSYEQANEMILSGLISIESHTYDMHQWAEYDTDNFRSGVLKLPDEDEQEYIDSLRYDIKESIEKIIENTSENQVTVLSYPYGLYSSTSENVLNEEGIKVSVITEGGDNTVIKGNPDSLRLMKRYIVTGDMTTDELLSMINK